MAHMTVCDLCATRLPDEHEDEIEHELIVKHGERSLGIRLITMVDKTSDADEKPPDLCLDCMRAAVALAWVLVVPSENQPS